MPELTASNPKITPFLWFADEAEEAATFYVSIFPNARITGVTRYGDAGQDVTGTAKVVAPSEVVSRMLSDPSWSSAQWACWASTRRTAVTASPSP
jgi:hypothetical protein